MQWKKLTLALFIISAACFTFSIRSYAYNSNTDEYGYDSYNTSQGYDDNYYAPPHAHSYSVVEDDDSDEAYDDGYPPPQSKHIQRSRQYMGADSGGYASRMPQQISSPGEKVIIVNPRVHAWGAYAADGHLVKGGLATSGSNYCRDIHRRCHTSIGTFRIFSLGSAGCKSSRYPVGRGGAPMPYCMYFNKNQALHGSYETGDANLSHGCVRLRVSDAEWLRFNFANIGTKVIVKPY